MAKKTLPLVLGAGAVALAATSGKKKGKKKKRSYYGAIVKSCKSIKVTDGDRLYEWIYGASLEMYNKDSSITPFELLPIMMEEISAGKCNTFPDDPGSADAFLLTDMMLRIAYAAYRGMPEHAQTVPAAVMDQAKQFVAWRNRYELKYGKDLLGEVPVDGVGFFADYSKYYVGPKFYDLTVKAYIKGVTEAGGSKDDVFDTLVENLPVIVGSGSVVRAKDLPRDKPAVQDFFTIIATKIQEA